MNNTRFATAIHIMTLLASVGDKWITSDFIAGSVNINPAMIRKELSCLNAAGLIESKKGKEGGVKLSRDANDIYMSDIFIAIDQHEVMGKKVSHPNEHCPIGKQINQNLSLLFAQTNQLVVSFLSTVSLKSFLNIF